MPNRVFLGEDGFIHNQHVGDQTGKSVRAMVNQLSVLTQELKRQKQPILALIDLTKLGKQDTAARMVASEALKTLEYDRAAIYGGDPFSRYVASLVIRASGQGNRARYFESKAEAEAFLRQDRKQYG